MNTNHSIFLLIFLLSWSCTSEAQRESTKDKTEQLSFIKYLGETGMSRGVTVEEIPGGGYILTGYTTEGEYGEEDVLLMKTNAEGETIWRKTFGGKGKDNGWAVRQTDDGGYIIVGYTNSFGKGGMDVYLIKTDAKGDTIWTKTYGGAGDEFGWDIRITKENDYIIAAQTDSEGNGEIDACLIKVDAAGNEKWSKTYGGDKVDRVFSVQQTSDGGFVAAGITYSFTSINSDDRDGYLLKTDSSGKQEWYKTFGKDAYDVAHAIAITSDQGYLITGYGESFTENGSRDVYLIKTDVAGEVQWLKTYGGMADERGIKGLQTKDGGYVAIGFTDKDRDVYLLKTDSIGESLWTRTFGSEDRVDFGYTVRETSDGGYILIGNTERLTDGVNQVLLIKTNGEGLVSQKE